MRLTLKNIGKIGTASVEINGITVIAGENNTGKSTVGRALFAVFNSFCHIEEQIEEERSESIANLLDKMYLDTGWKRIQQMADTSEMARAIASQMSGDKAVDFALFKDKVIDLLKQYDDGKIESFDKSMVSDILSHIQEVLNVSDIDFLKAVLENRLDTEFNEQVCNIFSENNGEIRLCIKDEDISVLVSKKGVVEIQNPGNLSLHTEAVYIDDPFVLDALGGVVWLHIPTGFDHQSHLRRKLHKKETQGNVFDKIVAEDKLSNIYEKISSVCAGDIVSKNRSFMGYQKQGSDEILDIRNLSAGLKTFVILKTLLMNGSIERNGTIILDEPEIHLHPKWQLLFAELIVLIQKEFGVHVLLNTHSPYFLRAIQVYSAKYETADRCKYYLSEVNGEQANITDVTDNIEKIYEKFAEPLQHMEDVRWQDA